MKHNNQLFYLMQMAGGTFPSGGFSQSWGLETYVADGTVSDSTSFKEFATSYLESTVSRCEGPVMCEAYRLAAVADTDAVAELEELSCAVKVTKESRESSLRMGKAFLRIMSDVINDECITELKKISGSEGITYPVIYGAVCGRLGIDLKPAVEAFVFSTVNALLQSAVKLVPLGNTQAQQVLTELYDDMEKSVLDSMQKSLDEISNFCPGFDIASIRHEFLTTRLYMS